MCVSDAQRQACGIAERCRTIRNGVDLDRLRPHRGPRVNPMFDLDDPPEEARPWVLLLGRICFIGVVDRETNQRLIPHASCVAIPSTIPETSSLVAMEALACGRPVVAFRTPALEELIEEGRTGFLVDDVDGMRRAFESIASLSSDECRRAAERRCSGRAMTAAYIDVYCELTRGRAFVRRCRASSVDAPLLRALLRECKRPSRDREGHGSGWSAVRLDQQPHGSVPRACASFSDGDPGDGARGRP